MKYFYFKILILSYFVFFLVSPGFVSAQQTTHPVGTNIISNGTVYAVSDAGLRPYTSAGAFLSYGFNNWANVAPATPADLSLTVGAFIPPRDGMVICSDRGLDQGTCYLITDGKKAGFTSEDIFYQTGFSFSDAMSGDVSFLPQAPDISDAGQAHLPGTLVNDQGTIRLVVLSGLVGIPSMEILNSWGYSWANAVNANLADQALPQISVLDYRLPGELAWSNPVPVTSAPAGNPGSPIVSSPPVIVPPVTSDTANAQGSTPIVRPTPVATSACGFVSSEIKPLPNLVPPKKGESYIDPDFGCKIKRLTDASAEGVESLTHLYSSVNPFNADSRYIIIQRPDGIMSIRDLDGKIIRDELYKYGIVPISDAVWSRTDPNVMYFHNDPGNEVKSYNIATNEVTILYTYSDYNQITFGGGEGDISEDGDHLAILADRRYGAIFTISSRTTTKMVDLFQHALDTHPGFSISQISINNIDITPNNQFYVMYDPIDRGFGLELWDSNMNYRYVIADFQAHADRARTAEGLDSVIVTNSADYTPLLDCPNASVEITLGENGPLERCLQPLAWDLAVHISSNNVGQDWCLVSTYNDSGKWPTYANELLKVSLTGQPTIRLAHTRSSNRDYISISRAAVSHDGKFILFDSDMAGSVDTYLFEL